MTRPHRQRRLASATVLLLVLLLVVMPSSTNAKGKGVLTGIMDKMKNKKASSEGDVEAETKEDEPNAGDAAAEAVDMDIPPQPVCKSDVSGAMNCVQPESKPAEVEIDALGEQQHQHQQEQQKPKPVNEHGDPTQNIFQCKDLDAINCPKWAEWSVSIHASGTGGKACDVNSAYMHQYCPISCNTCELSYKGHKLSTILEGGLGIIPFCQDNDFNCRQYADAGECDKNPEYMSMICEASCGVCAEESNAFGVGQKRHNNDPVKEKMIMERLDKSIPYMKEVGRNRLYKPVRDACMNKVPDCTLWAAQGECENNENYMKVMCAPACLSCGYLGSVEETCHGLPESSGPLWKPGDLNAFFETIVDNVDGQGEQYNKYNPTALSRPIQRSDGMPINEIRKDGPWLVLFENFVTDEEADRLVQIGHEQGYERSLRATSPGQSAVTEARSSGGTWCEKPSCMEDPLVAGVLERIASTTKSPAKNSEHLQLLQYQEGQFYGEHHDFIPDQLDQPCGARIMTLFLYLNDVEEGGNTSFPELDISVKPKKGSALLWPSVMDEDHMEKDPRTNHEAVAVTGGVKYGANVWIHSEDFQTPHALKCI